MSKKNQITYCRPQPAFLQRIRAQVGYQEITDVDTKKQTLGQPEDKDLEDLDDEKPTVVITEKSNLTKEEQEDYAEKLAEVKSKPAKILFKKPVQKADEESSTTKQSSSLKSNLKRPFKEEETKKEEDKFKKAKQKEMKSLLSFDDEEDF